MVAPRMVGKVVRDLYVEGSGAAAYVGVHQDATGKALATALAIAKGIGATRTAVIDQSFADETDLDLAMEQVVDAAIYQVLIAAFETFVESGFDPAVVALEMYASKELAETAREWAAEQAGAYPTFERLRSQALAHPLNEAEEELKDIVGGG